MARISTVTQEETLDDSSELYMKARSCRASCPGLNSGHVLELLALDLFWGGGGDEFHCLLAGLRPHALVSLVIFSQPRVTGEESLD